MEAGPLICWTKSLQRHALAQDLPQDHVKDDAARAQDGDDARQRQGVEQPQPQERLTLRRFCERNLDRVPGPHPDRGAHQGQRQAVDEVCPQKLPECAGRDLQNEKQDLLHPADSQPQSIKHPQVAGNAADVGKRLL